MAVVISQNVVMSELLHGGSGRPIIGWHNLATRGSLTATSENQYYPVSNLSNPSTASQWRSDTTADQYVTVAITSPIQIDYVGIARHNFYTAGSTVSLEVRTVDNPASWSEVFTPATLGSNDPAILRFDPVAVTEIRIRIQNSTENPRIGVLYVGKLTVMQYGMAQEVAALPYAYETDVVTGQAESGDFLGRIVTGQSKDMQYTFEYIEYDWYHENLKAFTKAALITPFFFAWLPKAYPDEVGFGWLQQDVRPIASRFESEYVVSFTLDIGAIAV